MPEMLQVLCQVGHRPPDRIRESKGPGPRRMAPDGPVLMRGLCCHALLLEGPRVPQELQGLVEVGQTTQVQLGGLYL